VTVITSAHHLDEAVPGLPIAGTAIDAPRADGEQASRLLALYEQVAAAVARELGEEQPVTVAAADCMTSLGVLTALQRAGLSPAIVWLDAHGDFNTPQITESGYIGGMPLAVAVGHDVLELGARLGLEAIPEERVLLAGARDLDAAEAEMLASSAVAQVSIGELDVDTLPQGPIYLHVDVDVIDAADAPGLLFPVADGPGIETVAAAIGRVRDSGRVVAIGLACTWRAELLAGADAREVVRRLRLSD
jgi:arginase